MKPIFMWAGGKKKLLRYIRPFIPSNIDTYYEPFFGGGAVFCEIVEHHSPKNIVINDTLHEIIQIYRAIQTNPKEFLETMDLLSSLYLPLSYDDRKKFYYKIRHQHAWEFQEWNKTVEAAYQYFLFKTGFNGIFQINKNTNGRFGTPCGLLNQTTKVYDKENIIEWNIALSKTIIKQGDWYDAVNTKIKTTDFIFFDPPYRNVFTQYGQTFSDNDQLKLIDFCQKTKARIVLCNKYTDDNFFETNKGALNIEYINTAHTAGRRSKLENNEGYKSVKVKEILLHNMIHVASPWLRFVKSDLA